MGGSAFRCLLCRAGIEHGRPSLDARGLALGVRSRIHLYRRQYAAARETASATCQPRFGYVVADLDSVLRGWGAYFRYCNSSRKFNAIDSYVHMRMATLASTKHGLHGRHWDTRFTYGWLTDLRIYRLTGKVRSRAAHA